MTVPPPERQEAVTAYIQAMAQLEGIPVTDLTPQDFQVMGHAIRIADPDEQGLQIANDLDSLSELQTDDVDFLESIPELPETPDENEPEEEAEEPPEEGPGPEEEEESEMSTD